MKIYNILLISIMFSEETTYSLLGKLQIDKSIKIHQDYVMDMYIPSVGDFMSGQTWTVEKKYNKPK